MTWTTAAGWAASRALDDLVVVLEAMRLDGPMRGSVADLQRPAIDSLRQAIAIYDERQQVTGG